MNRSCLILIVSPSFEGLHRVRFWITLCACQGAFEQLLAPVLIVYSIEVKQMAIHEHNNVTQTKWDKGGFKAMIKAPNNERPVGFCDGTPADESALVEMAELEGMTGVRIQRKNLKTGREIWTVVGDAAG